MCSVFMLVRDMCRVWFIGVLVCWRMLIMVNGLLLCLIRFIVFILWVSMIFLLSL